MIKSTKKKELKMKKIDTTINFGGFYESIHHGNIESIIESYYEDGNYPEYNYDNIDYKKLNYLIFKIIVINLQIIYLTNISLILNLKI